MPRTLIAPFRGDAGEVVALEIHEVVRMRRQDEQGPAAADVPAALRPYLGACRLAVLRADFTVRCEDGGLVVRYPKSDRDLALTPAGPDRFVTAAGKHQIWFGRDAEGLVTTMFLDAGERLERLVPERPEVGEVKAMLQGFHAAGAECDVDGFFAPLAADAIVLGTDASERWTVAALRPLVEGAFARGGGFRATPTEQNVYVAQDGAMAWFDERLRSDEYGEMRGSGVARKTPDGWRIVQYVRSFPIPNELVPDLVERIAELGPGR